MTEMEEQPKLDNTDKDQCPVTQPEHEPDQESDSVNDDRARVSVSESTSKPSEPHPKPSLLSKQPESPDQIEANTTIESEDSSGEQFEVVRLSSLTKKEEEPCKETEEGVATPPQAEGDNGKELQIETKEPTREHEAYDEEDPAPQAEREDKETIAPTQAEEAGADSGRTTPKDEDVVLETDKEAELERDDTGKQEVWSKGEQQVNEDASEKPGVAPIEAVGDDNDTTVGEVNAAEREKEESDEKMEVETFPVAADRADEDADDADSGGASSEQQREEGGVEEDTPEMETEKKIDAATIKPLETESLGEAGSGDAVVQTTDATAAPMEEDIQKEADEPLETKMETECATDEHTESTESEYARKNETVSKQSMPPEAEMETENVTATEHVSTSEADVGTGNVTIVPSNVGPVKEAATTTEASKQHEATEPEVDDSKFESTSLSPLEDNPVEPESAKDNENSTDMTPSPTSHDEEGGEDKDDDEQGLPLVQLGGATSEAPTEQTTDEGSVHEQEQSTIAVEGTTSAGDTETTLAEPAEEKQDSERQELAETVEVGDNPEKVESDIEHPEELTQPGVVEQNDKAETAKLESSFESFEPETLPSKESVEHVSTGTEKNEIDKGPEEAMDEETVASVSTDDQRQADEGKDESAMGTRESETPPDKMEIADSSVGREKAIPDTQGESPTSQESQATESTVVIDQTSKEQDISDPVEIAQDISDKTQEAADEDQKVTSSSPVQSEASDCKEATSDDSSKQPLPSTQAPPTSTSAPPTSTVAPPTSTAAPPTSTFALPTSSSAPASSTSTSATASPTSVGASLGAGFNVDTTSASTVSTSAGAVSVSSTSTSVAAPASTVSISTSTSSVSATSASAGTVLSISPPATVVSGDQPHLVIAAPQTNKDAVTCTVKTTVTVSAPPILAPPTSKTPPTSSSSQTPCQAPPTTTPTSTEPPSVVSPTTTLSSSKVPSQAPPTTTPTSIGTPSIPPPTTTPTSSSFKVPSLTNVPSLSLLTSRSSTLPHTMPSFGATPSQAVVSKPSSAPMQSTSVIGAKLPSFDTPQSVSSVPTTATAVSKASATSAAMSISMTHTTATAQIGTARMAKLPSFSSVFTSAPSGVPNTTVANLPLFSKLTTSAISVTTPVASAVPTSRVQPVPSNIPSSVANPPKTAEASIVSASAPKPPGGVSTLVSGGVPTPISVAQLPAPSTAAVSTATPAMTSSSSITNLTNSSTSPSSTTFTSPSPSSTTTTHKDSQQQPPAATKPHTNTISVITQLPASFTAAPKTASSVSGAAVVAGGGHYSVVLGVGPGHQREQNIIVGMHGAERLKVGEAEILQVSGESDLRLQQQKIEVKSREEMMGKVPPQVAVIPPIIDLTRTPEYSQVEKLKGQGMVAGDVGKGKSSSVFMGVGGGGSSEGYQRRHSGEMKSVEKTTGVVMAGQEFKSHIGELKASSHPVARRIWMSSCRPLDPASLERIGVDSKGTVYWYDGGKNMFQSPPSNDPAYKPSESELQLSCKSMVQWTAKLKDLRHSNIEADMKLAQSIKDQFLSRVRIATQRKPRDMSVIQKLQAVHSLRPTQLSPQQQQQQQQQQASASAKPTITLTTSQAAAAAAAAGAGGTVAIAAGSGGGDGIATQKTAQIVQGSFPQGSILVVPHPTHPFHAVLPVFANTAMLMPQAAVATTTAGATGAIVGAAPTSTVTVSQSSTNNKKVASASDGESTKVPSSVSATAQTILVQAPVTSQSLAALQASPSTVIQLSGSRNNVPGVSTSEKTKESAAIATKERSTPSKQPSSEMHVQQQTQKGIALSSSPQTATISIHPSFLPQALASGMITALPGGGVKFQDYRQALALSAMVQVMPVKVGEPVKLSTINFESKSIEISGEVPIKKVEVDKETGELIPVPVTAEPSEQEQQQQKGVVVESERTSSKEGEKSSKAKKHKANEEEGHVDVEGESRHGQVSDDKTVKSLLAKETREGGEGAFSGHSSSDIMSAQLLLSLTDPTHKDWSAVAAPVPAATQPTTTDKTADSAVKSVLTKEASIVLTPVSLKSSGRDETASPASSITSQHTTASGGRKRKQKPIASAKPDDESMTTTPTPKGRKGGRKAKQGAVGGEGGEGKTSTAKKKTANDKIAVGNKETPGRSKQLSPEELLILLDIPPSSSSTGKGSSKNKTPTTKAKGKGKDKSNQDGRSVLQSSNATAKMEELKASRADKPMKEYVIETDSDSADSSSSGTSSSRFSPDSGSSSDSSSDSSSEEGGGGGGEGSEAKVKPPPKKIPARSSKGGVARGRGGRGRGGRAQRKGKKAESSSAESSSEDEEEVESKKEPARARGGGGRARGGRGGRGQRGTGRQETKQQEKGQHGHIVSIPTNLLSHKPATGKKRKAVGKVTEAEKAATADYIPDLPVDLATLYATKGGVDLGTLSELTKSVNDDGLDIDIGIVGGGSRSKRTCVRMREEITKLQEILKDNGAPEVKPSPPARAKTTSMKASMKARSSSGRTSDVSGQESVTVASSSLAPVKKYRRPAYSQFTHKRRKRRRKQPEEEALWQPASRKGGSGESYKPVYLFSTFLANKAATAVETSRYNSIIQFHQAQPKDPGFLRLPPAERQTKPPRGSISDRKQTDADSGEEEMSAKETKSTPRGQKRRNSGRTSEGSTTRRSRNSEVESADKVPSPQPFLRSSRRLRQQRNRSNASPPPLQSPSSPDGPRSPLPPSPPSGVRPRPRKISQTAAGGSGSAVQQRSLRRKRNNQQQEESPTSPVPDLFEAKRSQQVEEMDSPSDDEDRMKEDEMSDGEFGARKKARLDEGEADKNVLSSPGMQSPEQQRSIPPPNSREEENYTICHGTPVNKSVTSDISSPKNWPSSAHHPSQQQQQQQQQMQNQQQIQRMQAQYSHHHHHSQQQQQMHAHQQQMQQYAAATQAAGHAAAQHQHRAPSTPSSEAVTFSPPMLHPGSSSSPVGGSGFDHRSVAAAGGIAAPGGGAGHNSGGGRDGSGSGGGGRGSIQAAEYAHRHHQLMSAAEHAHLRESNSSWAAAAAGLHPHQFPSVPGAYPGAYPPMYNPAGIPGMHYSGQPMAGANYPYPMPYHWGHHHPSVAGAAAASVPQFGEHMLQQQQHHHQQQQQAQQQHRQAATSKDVQSHHDVLQHPHISGHTAESPQSSSLHLRGSSSAQSVNVTSSMTAAAGKPSSRGHYPSPQAAALHQLASPVSAAASHTLSHQVPHGAEHLPPGAHQAAAAAATFPYGFDSSAHSLSHMHMLQQSQMQPQLTRPLHGVPPHHLPPHMASRGLWYSPQHMAAHQMMAGGGAEIPGHPAAHSKKATSKSSKSATPVDGDKNRNVNNNNNVQQVNISGAPTNQRVGSTQEFISANAYKSPAMTYPSGAHNSSSSSITPGATFSVENLAAPYNTAHLVGVSATPQTPPPHQGQRFGSNPGGGSLPAVSVILEQTRKQE